MHWQTLNLCKNGFIGGGRRGRLWLACNFQIYANQGQQRFMDPYLDNDRRCCFILYPYSFAQFACSQSSYEYPYRNCYGTFHEKLTKRVSFLHAIRNLLLFSSSYWPQSTSAAATRSTGDKLQKTLFEWEDIQGEGGEGNALKKKAEKEGKTPALVYVILPRLFLHCKAGG